MSIRITIDVENLSGSVSDSSFIKPLMPLLELLEIHRTKASFFVVGSLASVWSDQLIQLSKAGHEIGLHGHTHDYLEFLGPSKFERDLNEGKKNLENVIGREVVGFRAPYFSLTSKSEWAPDILFNLGFKFSSSVLPVWNPQAGFPNAPKSPFKWNSGLIEFPVPTFGFGKFGAPILGGAYLRLAPQPLFDIARRIGSKRTGEWSYCHPYDFDVDTQFERVREASWIFSKLLFMRRDLMLKRIEKLLKYGNAKSFEEQMNDARFIESLPLFEEKSKQ
jgi:polysaccharide deacetylase family protein (PEP-CTERM system associated)